MSTDKENNFSSEEPMPSTCFNLEFAQDNDFLAINYVDLFPNLPTYYVEPDFNSNSKEETFPSFAVDDQELNTIIVDDNSNDTLEKFDEECESDKKYIHCFTCDIQFRHTHELLSHLKQHVSNPTVTLMRLADSDDKLEETTEKEREYEYHRSLKLTLNHSGDQHFEILKSLLERPKKKCTRIFTAKEIKQSPPHNIQAQQSDAKARTGLPPTHDNEQFLENRYLECSTLDGLDQYATEENHTKAADDLLKKLLAGGQLEFQPVTANMCLVCHRSFPDVVQLHDHKRMTGHDVPNVSPSAPIPNSFTQPNNYRPRMDIPSNEMTVGDFRPHIGPAMRPTFVGRQRVPLKPKPQHTIRPRNSHLQSPSPIGTPSPPSTVAAPNVIRSGVLKDILVEPYFCPPPEKKLTSAQDDDCEIVFTSSGMDGLPVIQSVRGGVEQPKDNNSEKEAIQLNDQITSSLKNKAVNKDVVEVASTLANRGITVIHKAKQRGTEEAIQKGQASKDAIQSQDSINIISKKGTNMPGGSSAAARSQCGDSSIICCAIVDCNEKFLSSEDLKKHIQKSHQIQKLIIEPMADKQNLIEYNRRNHQRCMKSSADELGIPVIDLRNEDTKQKFIALGITNYIPLSLISANSDYEFPIVSVEGVAHSNIGNTTSLGVNSLLWLGPIKAIPTKKSD